MESLRSSAGAAAGNCAGLRSSSGASPSHRVCTTPVCVARCSGSGRGSVRRLLEPLKAATIDAKVDQGGDVPRRLEREGSIRDRANKRGEAYFIAHEFSFHSRS